ncbi:MAG: hypothetical protein JSV86_11515 [Gemmatimonadota bacterium]|nr:MAG: hypothetical protein JSV86_11515 [Gemmatimonadota bacterium]
MLRRSFLTAAAILGSAACAVQPSGAPAPPGLKLRITHWYCAPGHQCDPAAEVVHEGELIFASFDSVVIYSLKNRREFAVPVEEISRLEVYRGRRGSAAAALKGMAKGALLGAAAGAVFGTSSAVMGSILDSPGDPEEVIAAGAAGGAVIGAAGGAFDGATSGDEVWQEITVRRLLQDLCRCQEPEGARPDTTRIASNVP